MTSVKRLFVLLCGFEIIPKTVSTYQIGARFIISVPISAYLLDTDEGWVLFDTGIDERNLRDRSLLDQHFLLNNWDPPPVVKPHHELERQLNDIGIGYADIRTVILSHLHADHTGHMKDMPMRSSLSPGASATSCSRARRRPTFSLRTTNSPASTGS
jgi:N-acyl homoserine lactone hydrolase